MGYRVELYIYDLSAGMARHLVPMLGLNFEVEGIWHTAIVVHGIEWFYGSTGIEQCSPGGTMMGQPLKKEYLGETDLDLESFRDYLHGLGQDMFRGHRYDLFKHNCNNFSNTVAQFVCGKTIPQYILDLPERVLGSPIAQMLRPLIEQATPHGSTVEYNDSPTDGASNYQSPFADSPKKAKTATSTPPKSPSKVEYVSFSSELSSEKVLAKLRELNSNKGANKISDENLNKVGNLTNQTAVLDVKTWNDIMKPVVLQWPLEDLFPLLDILRWCSVRTQLPAVVLADIYKIVNDRNFISTASPESVVRLTLRLLANFFLYENSRTYLRGHGEHCFNAIQSIIGSYSSGRDHLELAASAVVFNFALSLKEKPDQELSFLLMSGLATQFLSETKNYDAQCRIIAAMNILIESDSETKDLALALDLKQTLQNMPKFDKKVEAASKTLADRL